MSGGAMQLRLSRSLEACADVRSVLDCVLNLSLNFVEADFGNVQLVDWKSGCLEITAQSGFGDEFLNFFERVKLQDGTACVRALRNREAIIIEDVTLDPQFTPCREIISRAGFRAVQSTPLISSSDALVGVLSTHFAMPHRPTDQQMLAIKNAAQLVANAIIHLRAPTAMEEILSSSMTLLQQSRDALITTEAVLSPASWTRIAQPLEHRLTPLTS
jgi:GAF domain-containing protein